MKLESNFIEAIISKLNRLGYIKSKSGLVTYGGKDNGTIDLLATNNNNTKSVIIELKQYSPHLLDLSQFISLKNNVLKDDKLKEQELLFYLIVCDGEVGSRLKELGKKEDISIEEFHDFLNKETI